jgi:hypothetical protein
MSALPDLPPVPAREWPHPDTRLAHAGCVADAATGAVVASPVFATTF